MKVRIPNTRIDLATGERFDMIVGDGEQIEVPQKIPVAIQRLLDEVRDPERSDLPRYDRQHNRHNRS